jgi:hypothetical protein
MRILPSQSSGMKLKVASTASFTTSTVTPKRSAIAGQHASPAPPSGSTPTVSPLPPIASMSRTASRSLTYDVM